MTYKIADRVNGVLPGAGEHSTEKEAETALQAVINMMSDSGEIDHEQYSSDARKHGHSHHWRLRSINHQYPATRFTGPAQAGPFSPI